MCGIPLDRSLSCWCISEQFIGIIEFLPMNCVSALDFSAYNYGLIAGIVVENEGNFWSQGGWEQQCNQYAGRTLKGEA